MKKKFKAFTLAELFIVLMVIGVIAALTLPNLGTKIDRNKGIFKKTYGVVERLTAELVNDEEYYPYNPKETQFGFGENTDYSIRGTGYCTSTTDKHPKEAPCSGTLSGMKGRLVKFCNLFSNQLNLKENPTFHHDKNKDEYYCKFTTNDGVSWQISAPTGPVDNFLTKATEGSESIIRGFIIRIDVNGSKDPNKPETIDNVANKKNDKKNGQGDEKYRDTFYMLVRNDGKIQLPSKDETAKSYLGSTDLNKEN